MKRIKIISVLFFLFVVQFASSQERIVVGKVVAFEMIPLRDVKVKVKSSGEIVKSDSTGLFSVSCKDKDKITFSANGFTTQKISVKEKSDSIIVNLIFRGGDKNITVATGFNHIEKDKLTYAIAHLSDKNIKATSYSNILEMIKSRAPGVTVTNNNIYIRGKNTMTGNDAALLVVDGVVVSWNEFKNVDPHIVKSIDVLKGTAGSLYGSRGMNGVVVVTIKKK